MTENIMRKESAMRPAPRARREIWEYDVKEFFGPWTSESIEVGEALGATKQFLDKMGKEGWEMVSVLGRQGAIPDTYVVFKRRG